MITFGSLFAGIGGIDLGLERVGMECAWQVELDDYCTRVLNKHWPDVPKHKDVRNVGKHNLETVDLIAGGFPCQPHSVAGKQGGAEDDRNLWPEFIRIVRDLKPRYVLGENVPGIVTTYIDTVLSDLEGEGYTCTTFNIPAVAFDAPHKRQRIFIVAFRENERPTRGERIKRDGKSKSGERRIVRRGSKSNNGRQNVADTDSPRETSSRNAGRMGRIGESITQQRNNDSGWWSIEPDVGRVAHGVSSRVDRLRGLGNAVVPQVAQWIGERIIEFERNNNDVG